MPKRSVSLYLLVSLTLSLLAGLLAYRHTLAVRLDDISAHGRTQANDYSDRLERDIDKYGLVPLTAALDHEVIAYLLQAQNHSSIEPITRYLRALNDSVGALRTYLIDPHGTIIATSDAHHIYGFVGRNISYRPYVQNAAPGKLTVYYGVGTTENVSGYYLSTAVSSGQRRLGVVALKITLDQLEHLWLHADQRVLLSDANGVVVLSSEPRWKYAVLGPFKARLQQMLDATQQYNRHRLHDVGWGIEQQITPDVAAVHLQLAHGLQRFIAVFHPLPSLSMQTIVLADPAPAYLLARTSGLSGAVLVAFGMAVMYALNQWRLALRERLLAQVALQAAYDQLEVLVEQRSQELLAANEGLKREVAERIQAAHQAQTLQQELIHTENLAVIGELSAGIAHEINQPLAALGTLAANAVRFLERGDLDVVRFNLERVTDLVERLGVLTGQLRSFARRSNGELTVVAIATSIESAIALLNHRLRKGSHPVQMKLCPPDTPVYARCNPIRLEQVLVNLISNAIDSTTQASAPSITLAWEIRQNDACIDVIDNGTGLSDEVQERLFEPFFTTKSRGGLGLGLAISADIIKSFSGRLKAANAKPGPGARFTIEIPAVAKMDKNT